MSKSKAELQADLVTMRARHKAEAAELVRRIHAQGMRERRNGIPVVHQSVSQTYEPDIEDMPDDFVVIENDAQDLSKVPKVPW